MDATEITTSNAVELLPQVNDPIERAFACDNLLQRTIPGIQQAVAAIRRAAVYDATLRPRATAATVAEELGVSVKAVSKAVAEQRSADRTLMAAALTSLDFDPAASTRDVPLMARRLLDAIATAGVGRLSPAEQEAVHRARERAEKILEGHGEG